MIKVLSLMLLISSCNTGRWHKQGASQQEFSDVNYICLKESQQPYFDTYISAAPGHNMLNFNGNYTSNMKTNEVLYNACMNAYGFYWMRRSY